MVIVLIAGLLVGLVVLYLAKLRIAKWRRVPARFALLAFGLYGFVPAIAMKLGVVETTTWGVVIAIIYFVAFSVIGAVLLNGIVVRAAIRD
jgi:hypothetical protein